jgi:hypothetical protein
MRKLNKAEKELVEDYRNAQIHRAAQEDIGFQELLSKLRASDERDRSFNDFLFDYIYNSTDSSPEWLNYLIENVYGIEE